MSTIKTGTTTTTGLVVEADTSGNLVVQTGATPTTALTISGTNQQLTFAQQPVVPVPAFSVTNSTAQTGISSTVNTKVQFDVVEYDSNGWFDNVTNYRYTPQIAGWYQFNCTGDVTGTSQTNFIGQLYKNGVSVNILWRSKTAVSTAQRFSGSFLVELNGSTDYVELFLRIDASSNIQILSGCRMQGFLVRAA